MHLTIWFSWPAGTGVNTAGILIAELLAQKGFNIWADKEYASIIKGDNNCFFVSVCDDVKIFLTKKIDVFFAFDQFSVDKNQDIYDLTNIVEMKDVKVAHKNIFAFWACLEVLGIWEQEWIDFLKQEKHELDNEVNLQDLKAGYERSSQNAEWSQISFSDLWFDQNIWEKKAFKLGNQLIGEGAISAGMEFYGAYPMTPITGVIDTIVEHPEVTFFQWEDEIAVAMAMLGAKYAWKRAMCGTSWGGFALMTESISFSHQAEIGWVYLLGMRDWPSTGTPTFTGQWDLAFAMNASFWETSPAVLAPSTFEEVFTMMGLAFNRSDKYQHPIVVLVDKQLAEWYKTVSEWDLVQVEIDRWEKVEGRVGLTDDYLRYRDTESWISPEAIPWTEGILSMTTSYEHDESGATNENPIIKQKMMEKRFRRRMTFYTKEYSKDFQAYEVINPYAEKFFVTRGINRYNLEKIIENRPEWGLIVIKIFHPFSAHLPDRFETHKNQIKKLIFVEMNYEWQMEKVVRNECNLKTEDWNEKISHFRKYSLYPIFLEEVEGLLKE